MTFENFKKMRKLEYLVMQWSKKDSVKLVRIGSLRPIEWYLDHLSIFDRRLSITSFLKYIYRRISLDVSMLETWFYLHSMRLDETIPTSYSMHLYDHWLPRYSNFCIFLHFFAFLSKTEPNWVVLVRFSFGSRFYPNR